MVDAVDPEHEYGDDDWPTPGWYFTVENSDGLIFVYLTGKVAAELWFGEYQTAYVKWDGE